MAFRYLPRPARRQRRSISLPRQSALDHGDNKRHCANCGDFIDPIDWCAECQKAEAPCGTPHKRLRKRADAAFCDAECRTHHRNTFIRDCLPAA